MNGFNKLCRVLSGVCCGFSAAASVIMVVLVTCDTTSRTLFKAPFLGTYEICQYLLCIILFGGYAWCQSEHGFLHVTMFIRKFPRRLCCVTWAITSCFSVAVGALLSVQCFQQSMYALSVGAESLLLGIPQFPFQLFACFAMAILVLDLLADAIKAVIAIFNEDYAAQIIGEWV